MREAEKARMDPTKRPGATPGAVPGAGAGSAFLRTTCAVVVCAILACAVVYADDEATDIDDAIRDVTRASEKAARSIEETVEAPITQPAMDADDVMPDIEAMLLEHGTELTSEQIEMIRRAIEASHGASDNVVEYDDDLPDDESAEAAAAPAVPVTAEQRAEIDALIAQLGDMDDQQLADAEAALAAFGPEVMVPLKLASLSDNFERRRAAGQLARRLRWRLVLTESTLSAHPDIIDTLNSEDPQARAAMVDKVITAGGCGLPFLGECLADDQPYIRQRAIDGMMSLGYRNKEVTAQLRPYFDAALDDADMNIRLLVIGAMVKLGSVDVDRLAKMLDDPSLEVRTTVVHAMGYSGNPAGVKYVKAVLSDPRWQMRAAALEALEDLVRRDESVATVGQDVVKLLADPDPFVRQFAAKLIGRWEYRDGADAMWRMVERGELDRDLAITALASMGDARTLNIILEEEAAAATPDQRMHWLSLLESYRDNAAADQRLLAAIDDQAMRPHLVQLIGVTNHRANWQTFHDAFAKLLESDDEHIANAAWQAMVYRLDEKPLSREQLQRMLASGDAQQGRWALDAANMGSPYPATIAPVNLEALSHAHPQVVRRAVGYIASAVLRDDLDALGDDGRYYGYYGNEDHLPPAPTLSDAHLTALRTAAKRDSWESQVPAAALLYRTSQVDRDDDTLRAILAAALAHKEPDARRMAMAGIADQPDPFLDAFDVEAASQDAVLRTRAINILATASDDRYLASLLELAESADTEDIALWKALLRSGDEQAVAATIKAYSGLNVDSWDRRRFVTELREMPGEGPVRFIKATVIHITEAYNLEAYAEVAATLPHESAGPLLDAILKHPALKQQPYYTQSILRAALSKSPERHLDRIATLLADPDQQMRQTAVSAVLQSGSQSDELVQLLLDAGQAEQSREDRWLTQFAATAPLDALREQALPVLTDFDHPFQAAVLQRVEQAIEPDDIARLLATPYDHWRIAEHIALIVGDAVLAHPEKRPNAATLDEAPLVIALAAAAGWHDAQDYVAPYLADPRREVADAARRTLAMSLLARPVDALTDVQREVLIDAATGGSGITGYIAAEALGMYDPDALLAIDAGAARSSLVPLRQAVALAQRGEAMDDATLARVKKALTGNSGATASQLAIYVAGALPDTNLPIAPELFTSLDPMLTIRALTQQNIAAHAAFMLQLTYGLDGPTRKVLSEMMLAAAREGSDAALIAAAQGGLIEPPVDETLFAHLLRIAPQFERQSHGRFGGAAAASLLLPLANAGLKATVLELAAANTPTGFHAAVVAAVRWQDEASITRLIDTLGNSNLKQFHGAALQALTLLAPAQAEKPVTAYIERQSTDDWEQIQMRAAALRTLAAIAPAKALEILTKDAQDEDRRYYGYDSDSVSATSVLALFADAEDFKQRAAASTSANAHHFTYDDYGQQVDHTELLLKERTRDAEPTTTPSPALMSPWSQENEADWALTDDALRERTREVLPGIIRVATAGAKQHSAMSRSNPYDESYEVIRHVTTEPTQVTPPWMIDASTVLYASAYNWFAGGMSGIDATPGLTLDQTTLADALAPMLADEDTNVRRMGMRLAMAWRVTALAAAIEQQLGRDEALLEDAAVALALLRGEGAVPAIVDAHDAAAGFAQRATLACVLHALGSDAGDDTLDRALAVRIARMYREKFLNRTPDYRTAYAMRAGYRQGGMGGGWRTLLEATVGDAVRASDQRFFIAPDGLLPRDERSPAEWPQADLSDLVLRFDGNLHSASVMQFKPAMLYFQVDSAAPFAWLIRAERELAPQFHVQFANHATSAVDMEQRWRSWWADNKNASPEVWWRQGAQQAIEELADARWYHRVRGAHRLTVLTGHHVAQPALFDHAAWEALRDAWRKRLADEASFTMAGTIIAAAVDAGYLDSTEAASVRGDETQYLALLARLAGRAPARLAEAAQVRLIGWPSAAQVIEALAPEAATSPRGNLRTMVLSQRPGRSALRLTGSD